jgi:YesN/AraC family two-component response regulator
MSANAKPAVRVLIVDDDAIVRQALRVIVEGAGMFVVGEADNGNDALKLFELENPNVVCLDVEMPQMKGLDVLAKIRQRAPQAVVLVISAFTTTQNVLTGVRLKADGIIGKPFTRDKVIAEIERVLTKQSAGA